MMRTIWCALGVTVTVANGCSVLAPIPDRSRYFTLSAPADTGGGGVPHGVQSDGVSLVYGLGPVILPAYLDRNQVATRLSPSEVTYSQWDRWAEPLGGTVPAVLRQHLASELGTDAVVSYPWLGTTHVDYQIEVRLQRFETDTTGESRLDGQWSIRDLRRDRLLIARDTSLTRPGPPNDTAAATAALRGMLSDLGREIATAARDLRPAGPAPRKERPKKP
jgi:uncharacterized lipoprotein YmbA